MSAAESMKAAADQIRRNQEAEAARVRKEQEFQKTAPMPMHFAQLNQRFVNMDKLTTVAEQVADGIHQLRRVGVETDDAKELLEKLWQAVHRAIEDQLPGTGLEHYR